MGLENAKLEPVRTPLVGFEGSEVASLGMIELPVSIRVEPRCRTLMVKFLVVDTPFAYNEARKCYNLSVKRGSKGKKRKDEESPESRPYEAYRMKPIEYKLVELVQGDPSRTIRIRSCMGGLETSMIKVLRENVDMFAWSPLDFRGIDLKLIVHRLNVDLTVRLVQPKKRSFGTEKSRTIRAGGEQTAEGRYVSEIQYTDWLSNVVVVPKAFEKWRMCTGPKDRYPLPRIDIMVDSTTGYEMFSMMDAYQGYHKIYMGNEDRDKTSFITDGGIYCYNVMPFGLKIVGATYQRLVNKMFHDLIDKTMEVYVDDMLVKSKRSDSYLEHLKRRFTIMRSYGMKLNPDKCTSRVRGKKFLGYMVNERGIEVTQKRSRPS
ncbi:uncharacterized protein LOC105179780 [Sesamum indicum]|uniref:Uncharacterized protein LOC105179780 n=1 Tax=Sesamum indicum TaxID=4182 RepID=A0A6I9UQ09_SESIN|nr:uncharacterized protein LOC105179780 [Sesamum indicum]